MFELKIETSPHWVQAPLADMDSFLLDHAACERKASAMGLAFVVQYPDRHEIINPCIRFAQEELSHFYLVYQHLLERKLTFQKDEKDEYVLRLLKGIRNSVEGRFLDRLLTSAVIEARGTERFALLAHHLPQGALKEMYEKLVKAERGHQALFYNLALKYFSTQQVDTRLDEILEEEASIVESMPHRAKVH